jgi:hypothetical protein
VTATSVSVHIMLLHAHVVLSKLRRQPVAHSDCYISESTHAMITACWAAYGAMRLCNDDAVWAARAGLHCRHRPAHSDCNIGGCRLLSSLLVWFNMVTAVHALVRLAAVYSSVAATV